ncbi:MAG: NAD+ synthase [Proteobacteria bacterium]|nr:NAD+ synthase [Pseudomonadota bacterium]
MKIALAQINTTIGDFNGNTSKIFRSVDNARQQGCELVIFPELAIPGFPPTDYIGKENFAQKNLKKLNQIANTVSDIGVIVGFVEPSQEHGGRPWHNGTALIQKGKIVLKTYKTLLPSYDLFDEPRYFQPGYSHEVASFSGSRLGITICEDIWNDKDNCQKRSHPYNPLEDLANQGLDLLINISGSPFYLGKRLIRINTLSTIARKHRIHVAYVNQAGGNDSLLFDGGSMVIDPGGKIRAFAREFEEDLITFDMETNKGDIRAAIDNDEELLFKALCMGTRDYLSKCGFKQAIIGVSGGIDSALTACIAAKALGKENVLGVAMPSPYSSPESLQDAEVLAHRLGINFRVIPISRIFQLYLEELKPSFAGFTEDVTEENIQARIRGNILMALANKFNGLVLATGNKSEMAVGYCTLYGDMCGALAVIADIPKTMVFRLARYINCKDEIIPVRVLTKPPSAELKPNQTDQDILPPYDVLDDIITEYIDHNRTPGDIVKKGHNQKVVTETIRRIHLNEYKRKQAPLGLRATTRTFGSGRRYPIAHRFNF